MNYEYSQGFTFIELLIVFTVLVIVGTVGLASLINYSHSQEVASAALDLKTILQQTRSNAISQIKPSSCPTDLSDPSNNSVLLGYEFDVCAGDAFGRPAACKNTDDFEVNAKCDNGVGYVNITTRKYSSNLTISSTSRSYFFPVISAGVDNSGTVTVSAYGINKSITITNVGVIR